MGGGDAKKKEDGKDSSDDVLTLELACEYKQIPVSAVNLRCSLLAKVTASAQNNEDKRAPVTICAAIDRRLVLVMSSDSGRGHAILIQWLRTLLCSVESKWSDYLTVSRYFC